MGSAHSEVMFTGSLAIPGAGYFMGEGPGPTPADLARLDLASGLTRVITKMAIKLYPWPGPKVWPTEGVQPEKTSTLPADTFKSFFFTFPTLEQSIDAIAAMGKGRNCRVGAKILRL